MFGVLDTVENVWIGNDDGPSGRLPEKEARGGMRRHLMVTMAIAAAAGILSLPIEALRYAGSRLKGFWK